jgi:hypothetical protein
MPSQAATNSAFAESNAGVRVKELSAQKGAVANIEVAPALDAILLRPMA